MYSSELKVRSAVIIIYNICLVILLFPAPVSAQQQGGDSILQNATLENVVRYAIQRNPELKNASLNEEITETMIRGRLADWYPQINFNYSFQRNFQLPTSNFNGQFINIGVRNTSGAQFGLTQNFFNRDVLLATRT